MITVEHLTKRYGRQLAVDDATFTCAAGTVTGFLGPNGAGKSTTLRALTGLIQPTAGQATLHGRHYRDLPNPGRLVGVVLDASAQHPGRTGLETLRLGTQVLGLPASTAEVTLERVGLRHAGRKRVGEYSLGMRQRLGIGMALLGDPSILILDEPANGMDPEGIRWMRLLLQDFAARGGTALLSSHLLGEVQATVDRLIVIGNGRIVADDDLATLLAGQGTTVRALDQEGFAAALGAAGYAADIRRDGSLQVHASALDVGRVAAASQHVLRELREGDGGGLEELFFQLTSAPAAA